MSQMLRDVFEGSKLKAEGRTLRGPFSFCDKENRNERKYSRRLWENVLGEVGDAIASNKLLGELDHPDEERNPEVLLKYVSHKVTDLHMEGNTLMGELEILDTPMGQILMTLKEAGVPIMVSSRALGKTGKNGYVDEDTYQFITFDCVADPSFSDAVLNESGKYMYLHKSLVSLIKGAKGEDRDILTEGVKRVLGEKSILKDEDFGELDSVPGEDDPLDGKREDECEETDEVFIRNIIQGYRGIVETARVFMGTDIATLESMVKERDEQILELRRTRLPDTSRINALLSENLELMSIVEGLVAKVRANDDMRVAIQEEINQVLAENADLKSKLRVTTSRIEEGMMDTRTKKRLTALRERAEAAEDLAESLRLEVEKIKGQLRESRTRIICEQNGVDYQRNREYLSNLMNESEVVERVKQLRSRSLRQLAPMDESVDLLAHVTPSGDKRLAKAISRV